MDVEVFLLPPVLSSINCFRFALVESSFLQLCVGREKAGVDEK